MGKRAVCVYVSVSVRGRTLGHVALVTHGGFPHVRPRFDVLEGFILGGYPACLAAI